MLAGYLVAGHLAESAMVLGRDVDFEVQAATAAAGQLGLRVEREQPETTDIEFLAAARRAARWEHLAGGFVALEMTSAAQRIGQVCASLLGRLYR